MVSSPEQTFVSLFLINRDVLHIKQDERIFYGKICYTFVKEMECLING